MSSLRFTKPIHIDGLPAEAAAEFVGLHVGLASAFPQAIGLLQSAPTRWWDDKIGIYRFGESAPPINISELADELQEKYLWITRGSLIHSCKYSQPERSNLLAWLMGEGGSEFEYFAVGRGIVEYLP